MRLFFSVFYLGIVLYSTGFFRAENPEEVLYIQNLKESILPEIDNQDNFGCQAPPTHLIRVKTAEELKDAVDSADPGDSIVVEAGTYKLKERIYINDSGEKGKKIYLIGDTTGERPLLDFSALDENSSHQGIVLKANYWYIKGLQIYKTGDNGMQVRGNNNIIEFCSFSECSDTGLQLDDGAADNRIINCDSYFNADAELENADGFAVKMDVGSGNRFTGCRAWNNLDDGWDGYLREADDIYTTYENCWSFNNGYLKNGHLSGGDGNGFKTGGSDNKQRSHNASYYRCIAADNASDGFDHNSNRGEVSLINCSATGNGRNIAFAEKYSLIKITIINTLSFGDYGKYNANIENVQNNSWQLDIAIGKNDFVSLDVRQLAAPRDKNGNLAQVPFLRPKKNSPLATSGKAIDSVCPSPLAYLGALEPSGN